MTKLSEIQARFQQSLLIGDDTTLALIAQGTGEPRENMLKIYQNAYWGRLHEVLGKDYEQLHAYLGDQAFETLAGAYFEANPSHHTTARWIGDALPAFLSSTAPWAERSELAEIAALEQALNAVFDEREQESLNLPELAEQAGEEWPLLALSPVAATRRLDFNFNAVDIWTALRDDAPPPEAGAKAMTSVLVYRHNDQSHFRTLGGEEAMMWDEMRNGTPFGTLCELVATWGGEDDAALRAAGYLQNWISAGLILIKTDQDKPDYA